jgi:hypothetical protein
MLLINVGNRETAVMAVMAVMAVTGESLFDI